MATSASTLKARFFCKSIMMYSNRPFDRLLWTTRCFNRIKQSTLETFKVANLICTEVLSHLYSTFSVTLYTSIFPTNKKNISELLSRFQWNSRCVYTQLLKWLHLISLSLKNSTKESKTPFMHPAVTSLRQKTKLKLLSINSWPLWRPWCWNHVQCCLSKGSLGPSASSSASAATTGAFSGSWLTGRSLVFCTS